MGTGAITGPFEAIGNRRAARENRQAVQQATDQQLEALEQARVRQEALGREGAGIIEAGTQGAIGTLAGATQAARLAIGGSGAQQQRLAQTGFQEALGTLGGSQAQSLAALQAGQQGAAGAFGAGQGQAQQFLGQAGQTLQDFAGRTDLNAPIEADAGFQFRQQQGEQAINRSAAARGGRLGGGTLQALAQFNQGLASQEAQNVFGRRLAQRGQDIGVGGQVAGLLGQQGGLAFQGGAQQGNLQFQGGQLQSNLIGAQGQGLADLQLQNRLGIGNLIGQRGQQFADINLGFGAQSANLQAQGATGQANALNNLASQQGLITQQQVPLFQQPAQLAGRGILALTQGAQRVANSVDDVARGAVNVGGTLLGAG